MKKNILKSFILVIVLFAIGVNTFYIHQNNEMKQKLSINLINEAIAQDDESSKGAYASETSRTTAYDVVTSSGGVLCTDHIEITIVDCIGSGTLECVPGCTFYSELYCNDDSGVYTNSGPC